MNTCVIIPAFNEADNIAGIVKKLKSYNLEILVVDDGSQDNTAKVAEEAGAKVIRNDRNYGKGASLIQGFNYVLRNNFDAVITMDGDGQHLPEDVLSLMEKANELGAFILIGNRMSRPYNMPLSRKVTNLIMSAFISLIIRQRIPDTQCGFRFIRRELLEKLKLTTQRYETESEIIIRSADLGYRIESVPINCIYQRGAKSQIKPLWDTFRFLWFIIRYYMKH